MAEDCYPYLLQLSILLGRYASAGAATAATTPIVMCAHCVRAAAATATVSAAIRRRHHAVRLMLLLRRRTAAAAAAGRIRGGRRRRRRAGVGVRFAHGKLQHLLLLQLRVVLAEQLMVVDDLLLVVLQRGAQLVRPDGGRMALQQAGHVMGVAAGRCRCRRADGVALMQRTLGEARAFGRWQDWRSGGGGGGDSGVVVANAVRNVDGLQLGHVRRILEIERQMMVAGRRQRWRRRCGAIAGRLVLQDAAAAAAGR